MDRSRYELSQDDWQMVIMALESYVITQEARLISANAGDAAWQEVTDYDALITKIQLYTTEIYD